MGKEKFKHFGMSPRTALAAGIDVGKYELFAKVLGKFPGEFRELGQQTFTNDVNGRREACCFLDNFGLDIIVLEKTGAYSDAIHAALESHHGWKGQAPRVVSIQPVSVKRYPGEVHTDPRSAIMLAKLGLSGLLDVSYMPSMQGRQLRDLTRMYSKQAGDSTQCINKIKEQLSECGYMLPDLDVSSAWGLALLKILVSPEVMGNIKLVYDLVENDGVKLHGSSKQAILDRKPQYIRFCETKIPKTDCEIVRILMAKLAAENAVRDATCQSIEELVNDTPMIKRLVDKLSAIDGISMMSATIIIAEVDNIHRFPTQDKFLLYSGNTVAPDISGKHVGKPRMTKRCNHHLRDVFRVAGRTACEIVTIDSDIKHYARKQMQKNNRRKKKAYANTGAKIARVVYKLLRDDVEYERFHALHPPMKDAAIASQKQDEEIPFALKEITRRTRRFRNYIVRACETLPPGITKTLHERIREIWKEIAPEG